MKSYGHVKLSTRNLFFAIAIHEDLYFLFILTLSKAWKMIVSSTLMRIQEHANEKKKNITAA